MLSYLNVSVTVTRVILPKCFCYSYTCYLTLMFMLQLHVLSYLNVSVTVTHVILPKQRGTPDSCQTLAEEELFEYQDKLDLITVGWIHVSL